MIFKFLGRLKAKIKQYLQKLTASQSSPTCSEAHDPGDPTNASPAQLYPPAISEVQSTSHGLSGDIGQSPTMEPKSKAALLQERLWNEAYDQLKQSENKVVEAYERILSDELQKNDSTAHGTTLLTSKDERRDQMIQLIEAGLKRIERERTVKEGLGDAIEAVYAVESVMNKAVKAAPEAAIAWVGVCFGIEILSNPVTEAVSNYKGIAYVTLRMEWYWNLVYVLVDNETGENPTGLRQELEKHFAMLYQKLLYYQMQSTRNYYNNRLAVLGKDMLKLDDWAGKLNEIKETEGLIQRDLNQYNSERVKVSLQSQETNFRKFLSAFHNHTIQQQKDLQDENDKACLRDLYITNPSHDKQRIQDSKGGIFKDSYCWILENINFRTFCTNPRKRFLWIKGDPGKGKTCCCVATDDRLSSATAVLRGLVFDLARKNHKLIKYVRDKYDHTGKDVFVDGNAWYALAEIATAMFNDACLRNTIIIIDALDECSIDREKLLDFISKPSPIRWIVSSRDHSDIEEKLKLGDQNDRLELELNQQSMVNEAVNSYISHKVDQLAKKKTYSQDLRAHIHQYLTQNSDGTFLWVALVCEELGKSGHRDPYSQLKRLPSGLNSLYERMVNQILPKDDADSCPENTRLCTEILALVSITYRPLALMELRTLLELPSTLTRKGLEEVIKLCGSFLTLSEGVVFFVHQSAKDYLLNQARDQILPRGIQHQHGVVFSQSLKVLSGILKRDPYNLYAPGFPIEQVSAPDLDPLAPVRYPSIFWVNHLDESRLMTKSDNDTVQERNNIKDFFETKCLYWLEALSLLRNVPAGTRAIRTLEKLLNNATAPDLQPLIKDASRFILSHRAIIETSPLQVYGSALVFSPTGSFMRQSFEHEEPEWIALKPIVSMNWGACLQTIECDDDDVSEVIFSSNGQMLSALSLSECSNSGTIRKWDTESWYNCLRSSTGCKEHFKWCPAFSSDAQRLASGSQNGTIKIWDTGSAFTCLQTLELEDPREQIGALVFSPDGQRLASGATNAKIQIWDAAAPEYICLQTLESSNYHAGIASLAFSHDSQRLASGAYHENIRIWNAASGYRCLLTLGDDHHRGRINTLVFSSDSRRLISGLDARVMLWDAVSGQCLKILEQNGLSIACSNDGKKIAIAEKEGPVQLWDANLDACLQVFHIYNVPLKSIAFSADSQRLALASSSTIKIWDATLVTRPEMSYESQDDIRMIDFFKGAQQRESCSRTWTTVVSNGATGQRLRTIQRREGVLALMVFSHSSQKVASSIRGTPIRIWDTATGQYLHTLAEQHGYVTAIAFSHDGQRIASGSRDKTVRIWDTATGQCLHTLAKHHGDVTALAFSHDSQRIASGSRDKTVRIWDTVARQCLHTVTEHDKVVTTVAFSNDGQRLASGSDNTVNIWDSSTGHLIQILEMQSAMTTSVVFSHNGQRLAFSSAWGTISVCDVTSGKCLKTYSTHPKWINYLSWDPTDPHHISTDAGVIDHAELFSHEATQANEEPELRFSGYCLSDDGAWIEKDGKKVLWLPPEYRPHTVRYRLFRAAASTVMIACESGHVIVMRFSL